MSHVVALSFIAPAAITYAVPGAAASVGLKVYLPFTAIMAPGYSCPHGAKALIGLVHSSIETLKQDCQNCGRTC